MQPMRSTRSLLTVFGLALLSLGINGPIFYAQAPPMGTLAAESLTTDALSEPIGDASLHPQLGWVLAARDPSMRGLRQSGYRVLVATSRARLDQGSGDVWDSGRVASGEARQVEFAPEGLRSHRRYSWKVMVWDQEGRPSPWSAAASWYTGLLHPGDWQARWIAATPDVSHAPPTDEVEERGPMPPPLPIMRGEFTLEKPVRSAVVFVSGLGQYELHLNGKQVTQDVLVPAWSDYKKTVFYNAYDITKLLRQGKNAFGALLGNGMYDVEGVKGRYTKFIGSAGQPKLILQIHVLFADGSETTVGSDRSWMTTPGPILFSSIYGGEDYDARLLQQGWDAAGLDNSKWKPVLEVNGPGGTLTSQMLQSVTVAHTYLPVSVNEQTPTVKVYDLGQNMSGWPTIEVRGPAGTRVKLLPGELLDEKGHVTQRSANAGPGSEVSYAYTLSGQGIERWRPRFSYTGFRYVQVEISSAARGEPSESQAMPQVLAVKGEFLHDNVPVSGTFSTSDQLFQSIHKLIDMAILSNMFSVLTDCPTREKLGWLEQTYLAATSIMYNYNVSQLYSNTATNMRDAQLLSGLVPGIAPEYVAFVDKEGASTAFRDSPEWGSAAVLSSWAAYQFYGDKGALAQHYEEMRRYVAFLGAKSKDHLLDYGLGDWYDIGPAEPGVSQLTSKTVTASAIYYQDLITLGKVAHVLGFDPQAKADESEAAAVREAFNRALFHPDTNEYDRGSQTANAMPLVTGLVPEDHRAAVLDNLVKNIRATNNHVTAGDIGFHYVVRALTDGGRSDVLYDMLSRTDSPSYGYQVAKGATTLTEAWDTNPKSSQNHFMLGHAEEWFYRGLAGIGFDLSRPEGERIIISPAFVGEVRSVSATFHSGLGIISSNWRRNGGATEIEIVVPPGASAIIHLPLKDGQTILESGSPLAQVTGISQIHRQGSSTALVALSGKYLFTIR